MYFSIVSSAITSTDLSRLCELIYKRIPGIRLHAQLQPCPLGENGCSKRKGDSIQEALHKPGLKTSRVRRGTWGKKRSPRSESTAKWSPILSGGATKPMRCFCSRNGKLIAGGKAARTADS